MFVGGEFYYDQCWGVDSPVLDTGGMAFLNGGGACLRVIAATLLDQGIRDILLPAYLCPSIVMRLERGGLDLQFYQVREDLSIDLEDLGRKRQPRQAVYVINYFGFTHSLETLDYLHHLQSGGAVIVEDNVQGGFSAPTCGNFVFNSLRKLCPYDGGYLCVPPEIELDLSLFAKVPNRRLPVIRAYRERLASYLLEGKGRHSELNRLLRTAERVYEEEDVIPGDPQERAGIEHLDWEAIRRVRRENYTYLLSLIAPIPGIRPIFSELQSNNLPLGLPVYIEGVSRDAVCRQLARAQIGSTAHWAEIRSHPRTRQNLRAVAMAEKMLTLVVDQRFNRSHMEYLALKLAGAMAAS
jgi:hypothetical protein